MKVLEYLKKQLTEFVNAFKNAKVNYEYDEQIGLHSIEVLPQSVFDSDEFAKWERHFFKNAFQNVPGEDISFFSENAYVGINHVDWSIQGSEYEQVDLMLEDHITINVSSDEFEIFNEHLVDFNVMAPTFYDTFQTDEYASIDLAYTNEEYKDVMVLDNKNTIMSFDDSLLQAA